MTLNINGKKYDLEFTFAAADEKGLVQSMFKVVSGAYMFSGKENADSMAVAMIDGVAEMVADLPHICKQAFLAGMKEHNPDITYDGAVNLMKIYMKENRLSYNALYQVLKTQMEEDGFFDLTGITEMLEQMSQKSKKGQKQAANLSKKSTGMN